MLFGMVMKVYPPNIPPPTRIELLIRSTDKYISSHSMGNSKLSAGYIVDCCLEERFDIILLLAQAQIESHFGTTGLARTTNNPWNFRGQIFNHPDYAILPYINLIKNDYLMNGELSTQDILSNYVNYAGFRYAEDPDYEIKLKNIYAEIQNTTNISLLFEEIINEQDICFY